MTEHNHMPEWMAEVRRGKALGMIVDEASVTDTNGERVEISRLQNDGSLAPETAGEADAEQPQEDEAAAEQTEQEADGEA